VNHEYYKKKLKEKNMETFDYLLDYFNEVYAMKDLDEFDTLVNGWIKSNLTNEQ